MSLRLAATCARAASCAVLALVLAGCHGSSRPAVSMDASELLEIAQQQQQKDPSAYVESDLGTFRVTHVLPGGEGQLLVSFHLYGILPGARESRLVELLPKYENRLRDAVIAHVQRTHTEHLVEPSLAYFKAELVSAINRVLQDRLLTDVAFSDYSVERG